MVIKMDLARKLIVGYDLCEDYTQISCYSYKSLEPVPISTREEDELNLIPTVLCLKADTKQWLFGEEAIACDSCDSGFLIDHLLDKLIQGTEVLVYGQSFSPTALLEKYFRKTLLLVKRYFPNDPITKMVVTVRNTHPALVEGIYTALAGLDIMKDRVTVMSHAGAYLYYALSQDKSLWMNDVGLFDFSEEGLLFYQIKLNRRTRPMIAGLAKTEFSSILNYNMIKNSKEDYSYTFENIANTALHKKLITTLYFTGRGFEGDWAKAAIKSLCNGRRVFLGQNLFTKGACYAAKELSGDKGLEELFILDDDMITSVIGLRVYKDSGFREMVLAEAGELWYEVKKSVEVIPEGEAELEIILKNVMTKEMIREKLHLTNLPKRPDRMTRLEIKLACQDKNNARITVNDLGFGEFYAETGTLMEFSIEIG